MYHVLCVLFYMEEIKNIYIDNNVLIKNQEAKPQIWVNERSLCFHKKTLRYTCSCKSYAVFSEPHLSLSLSLSLSLCKYFNAAARKVPVLLRLRLLYDCLNINLGIISLTPMCKLRRQNHG